MPILRHDLEQALIDGLDVTLLRFLQWQLFVEFGQDLLNGFEGEVGVDGFGAVASQRRELMHFMGFARFHDETDRCAQALLDQVVMDSAGAE